MTQFENKGFVCNNSLLLFDVDNDNHVEFILGNIKGTLSIYKFRNETPIYTCSNLGSITCVSAVLLDKFPIIIATSAEGIAHFFCIMNQKNLTPFLSLKVPCNLTSALISKGENTFKCDLIFGSLDRNLYFYTFVIEKTDLSKSSLVLTKKIFCDKQIHSLAFHKEDKLNIIAGYQVGGYGVFLDDQFLEKQTSKDQRSDLPVFVHGNVEFGGFSNPMLSVNIEGKLEIHKPLETTLWSVDLEEEIVGVHLAKFAGNENQICVCTWDGITHIIDKNKNMVRFNLRDRVCSFLVGAYSISPTEKCLCIFYATFNDKVIMFSDVAMKTIPSYTLTEMVMSKAPKEIQERLSKMSPSEQATLLTSLLYPK